MRREPIRNRQAALVEIGREGLERIDDLLVQLRDAFAQRVGHIVEVAAERAVDFARQTRQAPGSAIAPRAQRLVDFGRFGVESADDFAAALAQDFRDFQRALGERFVDVASARLKTGVDAAEELFERRWRHRAIWRSRDRRPFADSASNKAAVSALRLASRSSSSGPRVTIVSSIDGELAIELCRQARSIWRRSARRSRRRAGRSSSRMRSVRRPSSVRRGANGRPERGRRRRGGRPTAVSNSASRAPEVCSKRSLCSARRAIDFSVAVGHDAVDRADLLVDMRAESLGVGADAFDDAFAAFANQALERIELRAELAGLIGQRRDESAAARRESLLERVEPGRQRLVDAVAVNGDGGDRLAGDASQISRSLSGLVADLGDRIGRRRAQTLVHRRAMLGDGVDRALRGLVESARRSSARMIFELAADLVVAVLRTDRTRAAAVASNRSRASPVRSPSCEARRSCDAARLSSSARPGRPRSHAAGRSSR